MVCESTNMLLSLLIVSMWYHEHDMNVGYDLRNVKQVRTEELLAFASRSFFLLGVLKIVLSFNASL